MIVDNIQKCSDLSDIWLVAYSSRGSEGEEEGGKVKLAYITDKYIFQSIALHTDPPTKDDFPKC